MFQRFVLVFITLSVLQCLLLVSALERDNVILPQDEMMVFSDSRVLIPCSFSTEQPINKPQFIVLEWDFTPEGSTAYRPILRLFDTILEDVETANKRAHIFLSSVADGNCSLVINPIYLSDSGTYEVRIIADLVPLKQSKIKVTVFTKDEDIKKTEQDITMHGQVKSMRSKSMEAREGLPVIDIKDKDPLVYFLAQTYQRLKKLRLLNVVLFLGGLLIFVMMIGSLSAIYFGCQYFRLKRERDDMVEMEEGLSSSTEDSQSSSENSESSSTSSDNSS